MDLTFIINIVLILVFATNHNEGAFIQSTRHTLPDGLQSLNGSDQNGGCVQECVMGTICQCSGGVQTSTALIDDVYPSGMIDTTQTNWAIDFFTINRNGQSPIQISFKFADRFSLRGVELKLFNCQSLGTAVHTINVYPTVVFPSFSPPLSISDPIGTYQISGSDLDCNSLTTIVIPTTIPSGIFESYFIEFTFPPGDSNTAIYLAEVRFSDETIVVPSEVSTSTSLLMSISPTGALLSTSMTSVTTTTTLSLSSSSSSLPTSSSNNLRIESSLTPSTSVPSMTSSTVSSVLTSTQTVSSFSTGLLSTTAVSVQPSPIPTPTVGTVMPTTDTTGSPVQSDATVGILVGVIVSLILVILIGIVIVVLCFITKSRKKRGDFNVHSFQGAITESNGGHHELSNLNTSLKFEQFNQPPIRNDHYEDVVHKKDLAATPGYSVITTSESAEPLYSEVKEYQSSSDLTTGVETVDNSHMYSVEENHYADISEEGTVALHPYSHVTTKDPPPIPKKTPELYRDLKIEAEDEQRDSSQDELSENSSDQQATMPPVIVHDENNEIVETVNNESLYQGMDGTDLNASTHSGLALLSKPVFENMETNPDYESPDTALSKSTMELDADEIYTNPDAIEESNTEVIYTDPDAVKKPVPISAVEESNTEVIYTDPDAVKKPASIPKADKDEIYTNPDASPEPDDIYTNPDAVNPGELLPAIYDSVYCESSLALIFDPDSVPPVYENTISDDDLFPYSPIYTLMPTSEARPLNLTPQNIQPVKILGAGCFGEVVLADTVGLSLRDLKVDTTDDDKTKSIQVAIKKLKPTASKSTKESFDKECKFMSRLNHPNVIRFLGVCREDTPYIMMEYLKNGDLNQYLENFETVVDYENEQPGQISVKTLIKMSVQISDAMKYLASHNYIHRDLAARNCLVGDSNIVKLADFGMSRSLYQSHYYIIKGRAVLPVRWMSTECFYGKFSVNSDIWAFGVTMWEIFTLTNLPYSDLTDKEVTADALKRQDRTLLPKPDCCPQDVYDIMMKCWVFEPKLRATFDQLFDELSALTHLDDDCV